MGAPKKEAKTTEKPDLTQKVTIQRKSPMEWEALVKRQAADHFRTLRVTIKIREKLYAGKPAKLEAAQAMIAARGLEDKLDALKIADPNAMAAASTKHGIDEHTVEPTTADEVAEAVAAVVKDEGKCEFYRREGHPGIWMPSNNLKAMVKENWSVLGLRKEIVGSRGSLAEGVFVYGVPKPGDPVAERDWIYLGIAPDGVDEMVAHTTGPKGPVSSIKRHEYVVKPEITFDLAMGRAAAIILKLPDEKLVDMLVHASEHGTGANRSQGHGKFDIVKIEEVEDWTSIST